MRLVRIAGIGLAAVVAVLVAALVYIGTMDLAAYKDDIAAEAEAATGRALAIGGELDLDVLTLTPAVVAEDVRLANAPWGSRPDMARVRRLELEIYLLPLLFGEIRVKRLVLVEPELLLETDAKGRANWLFGQKPAPEPAAKGEAGAPLAIPTIESVLIKDARITYRDGATGRATTVTLARATLAAAGVASPVTVDISGTIDKTPVTVHAEVASVRELLAGGGPVTVAIDARAGGSDVSGKLDVALARSPIRISGALSSKVVDVVALFGAAGGAEGAADDGGRDGRLFSDDPLDLAGLKSVDAELSYRAGTIRIDGPPIRNLVVKISLRGGRLALRPLTAEVAGGKLRAELTADGRGAVPALGADITLRKASLAALMGQAAGEAVVDGPLDLVAKVRGKGRSLRRVMAGLGGLVTVEVGRGRVRSQAFDLLSDSLIEGITPWAPKEDSTRLNCVVARFDIRGGKAKSRVLVLDTSRATVAGSGEVDLGRERVDLLLAPSTKQTSVASVAALVPIRVRGPLASPNAFPDPGEAAIAGAKTILAVTVLPVAIVGSVLGLASATKKTGDPCAAARATARGEARPAARAGTAPAGGAQEDSGGLGGAIEDVGKGIGKGIGRGIEGLKSLFK